MSRVPVVVFVDVTRRVRRHPYDVEPERVPAARRRVLRVARRNPPPSVSRSRRVASPRGVNSVQTRFAVRLAVRAPSAAHSCRFPWPPTRSTTSPPLPRGSPSLATRTSRAARTRAARASSLSPPFRACRTTPACIARTGSPSRVFRSFVRSFGRSVVSRRRPRARRDLSSRLRNRRVATRHRSRSVAGARDRAFRASRSPSIVDDRRDKTDRKNLSRFFTRDARSDRARSIARSIARAIAIDARSIGSIGSIARDRSTDRDRPRPRWMRGAMGDERSRASGDRRRRRARVRDA